MLQQIHNQVSFLLCKSKEPLSTVGSAKLVRRTGKHGQSRQPSVGVSLQWSIHTWQTDFLSLQPAWGRANLSLWLPLEACSYCVSARHHFPFGEVSEHGLMIWFYLLKTEAEEAANSRRLKETLSDHISSLLSAPCTLICGHLDL